MFICRHSNYFVDFSIENLVILVIVVPTNENWGSLGSQVFVQGYKVKMVMGWLYTRVRRNCNILSRNRQE